MRPSLLIALLVCLAMGSASALGQTVFACQEEASTGFDYKNGRWERANFRAERKFFLRITERGVIDAESAGRVLIELEGAAQLFSCGNDAITQKPHMHSCSGRSGGLSLAFNSRTGTGAYARPGGGSQEGSDRDTIGVTRFVCQRM